MNQSQLIKFDVVRNESEQIVDDAVIRLVPPEIPPQRTQQKIDHGTDTINTLALAEYDRGVVASETERIAQRALHVARLRLVEREVQPGVDLRIEILAVDRGGHHAVRDGEDAGQRFDGSGSTQQVDEMLMS